MAQLQAYFDDSKGDGVLVLAGYLSTLERWADFSKEWEKYLIYEPRWPYLKMQEVAAMENDRAWEKLMWMHKLIHESVLYRLVCAISIKDYWDIHKETNYITVDSGPHHFAMSYIMNEMLDMIQQEGHEGEIDLIFDTQLDIMVVAHEAYEFYLEQRRALGRTLISNIPTFRDDKNYMPLQAADFAAWWARKEYLATGDVANPPEYASFDGSRKWKENASLRPIIIQPSKADMKRKLLLAYEGPGNAAFESRLPERVRKQRERRDRKRPK